MSKTLISKMIQPNGFLFDLPAGSLAVAFITEIETAKPGAPILTKNSIYYFTNKKNKII